jgi:hypothetical protein
MTLDTLTKHYLESQPIIKDNYKEKEFEIRFGSNPKLQKPLNRVDYENVIKHIISCGFDSMNTNGFQMLRITNEFVDKRSGETKMSNIRVELNGEDVIKEYCSHNDLQKVLDLHSTVGSKIKFTQKRNAMTKDDQPIRAVDIPSFNIRAAFQTEQDFKHYSNVSKSITREWNGSLKVFRLINRVRFAHPDFPIFVDVSIVKSSSRVNRRLVPQFTIQESNTFSNSEQYEVELELDNSRVGAGTPYEDPRLLANKIKQMIRVVLSGLQNTKYPVSYQEQKDVGNSYMEMIHGKNVPQYINTRHFIGPSSYTLQMENISKQSDDSSVPNINRNYCVTEKADGERRLLYINGEGKIFMISSNMQIIFTGSKTDEKLLFNTLFDGEFIKQNKLNEIINLYAAFDLYYLNGKDIRSLPFIVENDEKHHFRLFYLQDAIKNIHHTSIISNKLSDFKIKPKSFYVSNENTTIFNCCSRILSNIDDGLFEYETDGLIFTPNLLPVGRNTTKEVPVNHKISWVHSFKWKPPEFNTIDFLVNTKKTSTGEEETHHVYEDGQDLSSHSMLKKYKTLILNCGFDETSHGYLNPCENIYQDNIVSLQNKHDNSNYKPMPFVPTEPYDDSAYVCNLYTKNDGKNDVLFTEEGEPFDDNVIVEFKYNPDREKGWNWIPLRVRYDKTTELRNGNKNYGNGYDVANSNWRSIHYPITKELLRSGENIPSYFENSDVYYNSTTKISQTRGLRDFHNLYVKSKLFTNVSRPGDTLIDYSVGKGGDIPKWMSSKLKFVFGVDISRDNIRNRSDGACVRYIKKTLDNRNMFNALFVVGDSSKNIKKGISFANEKDKNVSNAVFGVGPKDKTLIGNGVYKSFGVGANGFNVGSCQFALHYFFENKRTLHNFICNLSETIALNGHFIGTCYDGQSVFRLLNNKTKGESVTITKNKTKIFELIKEYDETGFPDSDQSIGYPINVYQETINSYFREYLVHFPYFVSVMEDYGLIPISDEEALSMNFTSYSGLFSDLFTKMQGDKGAFSGKATTMSDEEKKISFLNRYFVFKKVRNVDATNIMKSALSNIDLPEEMKEAMKKDEEEEKVKDQDQDKDNSEDKDKETVVKKSKKTKKKATIKQIKEDE